MLDSAAPGTGSDSGARPPAYPPVPVHSRLPHRRWGYHSFQTAPAPSNNSLAPAIYPADSHGERAAGERARHRDLLGLARAGPGVARHPPPAGPADNRRLYSCNHFRSPLNWQPDGYSRKVIADRAEPSAA